MDNWGIQSTRFEFAGAVDTVAALEDVFEAKSGNAVAEPMLLEVPEGSSKLCREEDRSSERKQT